MSVAKAAGQILGELEETATTALLPGGVAMGSMAQLALSQIHAGVKVEARISFDFPGPFDPEVIVTAQARLDDGHFRIKEFHLTPARG